jgi:tetratricopeptide (TPR) repeat protein
MENDMEPLRSRFLQDAASVLVRHHTYQKTVASDLREILGYEDSLNLNTVLSRFLRGEHAYTSYCEGIPLLFWRDVVAKDYPYPYLNWLDCAYVAYDLDTSSGTQDKARVRRLLAELDLSEFAGAMLFQPDQPNQRTEPMEKLIRGVGVGLRQRVFGDGKIKEGLEYLKEAIRGFRKLKPGHDELSNSDKFHIALAVHMANWLLSELKNAEKFRKQVLTELNGLGAIGAYAWLVKLTQNWAHMYNLAEIYGILDDTVAATRTLRQAIDINPRLAHFELSTKFDGVDEPLDKAAALKLVLPEIRKSEKWLTLRVAAFQKHKAVYSENINKGMKAMRDTVKIAEEKEGRSKRIAKNVAVVLGAAIGAASIWLAPAIALAASKPIF